jgi:hypothetical protein
MFSNIFAAVSICQYFKLTTQFTRCMEMWLVTYVTENDFLAKSCSTYNPNNNHQLEINTKDSFDNDQDAGINQLFSTNCKIGFLYGNMTVRYNWFQNRRHKQLKKKRTRGVTALERSVANCWFKPGSRVHQPHTCPNRFSYEQTSTSCLREITPTHPSIRKCCVKKHTNI